MSVKLTWIKFKDGTPPWEQSATIKQGGTIGRLDANDFVLHDPDNFASRRHATILLQDGEYYVEDTSSAGTQVNGRVHLQHGDRYQIDTGDTLVMGDCCLEVVVQNTQLNTYPDITEPTKTLVNEEPQQDSINSITKQSSKDTFDIDDFFNEFETKADNSPALDSNESSSYDNFDPHGSHIALKNDKLVTEESIDNIFQSEEADSRLSRSPSRPEETANGHQDTIALRAFLAELNMDPSHLVGLNKVDIMRIAGIIMRTLTEGMMGVLKSRESVKSQFNMDRTQIKSYKNNPLKFSSSAQEAMVKMLTQTPGYMDPVESALEAVNDAKAHQVAMVTGLNTAINSTISSFDPKKLENEFKVGFSINRKAKYWKLYDEKFERIAKSVESSTNNVFGEQFRESYESQIRKLGKT